MKGQCSEWKKVLQVVPIMYTLVVVVVVAFFSQAMILGVCSIIRSPPASF